jgi:hypothetical protein
MFDVLVYGLVLASTDRTSQLILDEHGLDDLSRHASLDVEVDGHTLQELPFSCIDLPVGKQQIRDDRERRRSQLRRDRPGGRRLTAEGSCSSISLFIRSMTRPTASPDFRRNRFVDQIR